MGKKQRSTSTLTQTRTKKDRLHVEQFGTLQDHGSKAPQLVLSIPVPEHAFREDSPYQQPAFRSPKVRTWLRLEHVGYRVGTVLTPRNAIIRAAVDHLVGQGDSRFQTLNSVIAYRDQLRGLFAVDCNDSFRDLRPGYYPIDTSYVSFLVADLLPPNLDDLIEWESGLQRAAHGGHWQLGILGPINQFS